MIENAFLASLNDHDAELIKPILRVVQLAQHDVLFEHVDHVASVTFPIGAVISLIVPLLSGDSIEAAMVGCNGGVGISAAMDGHIGVGRALTQLAEAAYTCRAAEFRRVSLTSPTLISAIFHQEQRLLVYAHQSTACIAAHKVENRLARWLLRAQDLSGSSDLNFTQEYLAEMMAVRRTSVSPIANAFQEAGLIRYSRGRITILDRSGLERMTCECHNAVLELENKLNNART